MASAAHVSKVRTLYKRILVLHRFMPIELRALGDQYVKDEFKRHKSASQDQVQLFMKEWEKYKDTLQSQVLEAVGTRTPAFGADLSEQKLRDLQDVQIGQLYELMLESTKPNRQFDVQEEDGSPK
ncbi:succinate dehydrogenase assembly factor 3, mitochondrial [Trichomycterus rosablanca]|uniref:succinate dehydrogenase assembly factor 3, mitochondrial n=1 Tax=Trichomycterus rosablanca TaxID=2290929 RepID=UPI002F350636